ncbi:MAG: riboflavin kinase, partial [Stomatobaculum sp.]|nr:riboflavin kinase [Stomatobaculum sp.]
IGGSLLGFPTVNLEVPGGKLMPRYGVYGTIVELEDGTKVRGITNIGDNPTVQNDRLNHRVRIESFLLDYTGDLYDTQIRIRFLHFIRPEMKFRSLQELKEQISRDIALLEEKSVDI